MTTMICNAEKERGNWGLEARQVAEPPLSYKLQCVVYVADLGYGADPRYAVEFEHCTNGWSSLELETNDGREALRCALRLIDERDSDLIGVRVEFVGPMEIAEALKPQELGG